MPIASVQRSIVAKEVSIGYQHVNVLISSDHVRGWCGWLFRCQCCFLRCSLLAIVFAACRHNTFNFHGSFRPLDLDVCFFFRFVGAIFGGGNPSLFRIVCHYRELGASWPLEYDRLHWTIHMATWKALFTQLWHFELIACPAVCISNRPMK